MTSLTDCGPKGQRDSKEICSVASAEFSGCHLERTHAREGFGSWGGAVHRGRTAEFNLGNGIPSSWKLAIVKDKKQSP